MKTTILVKYSLLCVFQLHRFIYQVEAIISRELLYPHDIVEQDNNRPYYVKRYRDLLQPTEKSEFNFEFYSETPQPQIKKKKKIKKVFRVKKNRHTLKYNDKEENVTKKRVKGIKKKKKSRKKSVQTFLRDREKSAGDSLEPNIRKPVDIIVHIKMED